MYCFYAILTVFFVLVDFLTKKIVVSNMKLYESLPVIKDVFCFTYVRNTGAAWSIFSGRTSVLGVVSAVLVLAIVIFVAIKKPKSKLLLLSLAMIAGGGIGNMIDRFFRGYVIDFLDFKLINFPVFNVADIFVVCGAGLLILYMLFEEKFKNADKTDG